MAQGAKTLLHVLKNSSTKAVSLIRCNVKPMPDNSTVTCRAVHGSWQDHDEEAGVVPGPQPSVWGWMRRMSRECAEKWMQCFPRSLSSSRRTSLKDREASDESEGVEKGENKRWKGWQWCTAAEQDTEGFSIQWRAPTLSLKTVIEKDMLLFDWLSEIYSTVWKLQKTIKNLHFLSILYSPFAHLDKAHSIMLPEQCRHGKSVTLNYIPHKNVTFSSSC